MAFANVFHLATISPLAKGVGNPDAFFWGHGEILPGIPISGFLEIFRFENNPLHHGILETLGCRVKPCFSKSNDGKSRHRARLLVVAKGHLSWFTFKYEVASEFFNALVVLHEILQEQAFGKEWWVHRCHAHGPDEEGAEIF